MKVYSIGNKTISKTISYHTELMNLKAKIVIGKLIKRAFPDCKEVLICSHWVTSFDSKTIIIEYAGMRIATEKSCLRENSNHFAIIHPSATLINQ